WLKEVARATEKKSVQEPRAKGPLPLVKKRLQRLPHSLDVWQADSRPMPHRIEIGGEPARPLGVLITTRSDDLVLAHQITEEPPSSDLLWDQLARAMQRPAMGAPHRPTELQVRSDRRWDELKPHLEAIGITVVPTDVLDQLDFVFEDMARH